MLTRRAFLGFSAAGIGLPVVGWGAATATTTATTTPPTPLSLVAKAGTVQLAPDDYPATQVWAYDGQVPGTMIRLKQGERLQRTFVNELEQASAVHWHGIRIANNMDGVPNLTQKAVASGASFLYDFVLPDAGTYWYHSHHRSWEQMARGLYGPLIVEEAEPPAVDRDEVLVIDDWRLDEQAQIVENFGSMHDLSHAGRTGSWASVNGQGMDRASLPVKQHERLRLRLINTANATVFHLALDGMRAQQVALDGMPLAEPDTVDTVTLAPAQRVDLIVDVLAKDGASATLGILSRGETIPLLRFPVSGQQRAQALTEPVVLPANAMATVALKADQPVTELRLEGGAMGQMRSAVYQGKELGIRELVQQGMAWAMNGVAGLTEQPLFSAKRGETVRIRLVNDTAWPHGMHTHGHHFREVLAEGKGLGPWRDTILLQRGETREIAFVADNPGDWLFHCHMLEHAAAGMRTWFRVA